MYFSASHGTCRLQSVSEPAGKQFCFSRLPEKLLLHLPEVADNLLVRGMNPPLSH